MESGSKVGFCTHCGAALAPGAGFCGQCGNAVLRAPPAAPATVTAPEPRPALAGERRQVTVLFCDLSGYTALSSTLDPEDVHDLLSRYFEVADHAVTDFGGAVDKHVGDAVMGVFGAPVAHGDDPERAVRAALDIHAGLERLSLRFQQPLRAHIGIATGEVVAAATGSSAHSEYTLTGDAVNLASRLEGLAVAGETLVSQEVYHAVASHFDALFRPPATVKGLEHAVAAWSIRGPCQETASVLPLAGRRAQCRQFQSVIDAIVEDGRGSAVVLRGEAGIGKTRLLEEFRCMGARAGFVCHVGAVLDFGAGRGQDAIGMVLHSVLGIAHADPQARRRQAVEQGLAQGLLESDEVLFVNDLLNLEQPAALRPVYDAMDNAARNRGRTRTLVAVVRRVAAVQPCIVAIEDIHWAQDWVLDCLVGLTAAASQCPLLLVMSSRVEGDPLTAAWRARVGAGTLLTLDIGPLAPAEAELLARGFAEASLRFAANCIARAQGNPLFLVQLLHSATETQETGVPASVQSLVLARLDRLPACDKEALQAVSVVGQRFGLGLLRHLLGVADYQCDNLVQHFLIRPDGDDYLFSHALIQEATYRSLLNRRKHTLHALAADWFADRDKVLHAEHLERAQSLLAAQAYLAAAQEQAAAYHRDTALALAQRGQAIATEVQVRWGLTMLQAELLLELGRSQDAIVLFLEAEATAANSVGRCRAALGVAAGYRVTGDSDAALAALERAQPQAAELGLAPELSRIHHTRGNLFFARGNIPGCLAEHQQALAMAHQADSAEAEANALSGLGDAYYAQGRMRSSFEQFERCVGLCQRQKDLLRIEIPNRCMVAVTRLFLLDVDQALADALEVNRLSQQIGQVHAQMFSEETVADVRFKRGEYDAAQVACGRALGMARAMGSRRYESMILHLDGLIHIAQGHRDLARPVLALALELSRALGMGFLGPAVLAAVALATDDAAARESALQEGEALLHAGAIGHCHLMFYREAIETCLGVGDWERTERLANGLQDFTAAEPLPVSDFVIERARILAARGRGAPVSAWLPRVQHLLARTPLTVHGRRELVHAERAGDGAAARRME